MQWVLYICENSQSMFKLLTFAILFYFAYRLFIKPSLPAAEEQGTKTRINTDPPPKQQSQNEEYIDYEEVD